MNSDYISKEFADQYVDDLVAEKTATEMVKMLANGLASVAGTIWRIGDGHGGYVRRLIEEAFDEAGLSRESLVERMPKKAKIPNGLRTEVFERDAYRCRKCGSYESLRADHVIPESKGGPTTLENLQTLCGSCNGRKRTRSNEEFMAL